MQKTSNHVSMQNAGSVEMGTYFVRKVKRCTDEPVKGIVYRIVHYMYGQKEILEHFAYHYGRN